MENSTDFLRNIGANDQYGFKEPEEFVFKSRKGLDPICNPANIAVKK